MILKYLNKKYHNKRFRKKIMPKNKLRNNKNNKLNKINSIILIKKIMKILYNLNLKHTKNRWSKSSFKINPKIVMRKTMMII